MAEVFVAVGGELVEILPASLQHYRRRLKMYADALKQDAVDNPDMVLEALIE